MCLSFCLLCHHSMHFITIINYRCMWFCVRAHIHIHMCVQYKCAGNSITRSMAYTGMCVTLSDGRTVLYPQCPGWTQAINTLGLAANPDSSQLTVEAPIETRMTRSDKRRVPPNAKVDSVYIFKVGRLCRHDHLYFLTCLPWNFTMTGHAGRKWQTGNHPQNHHGLNSEPAEG